MNLNKVILIGRLTRDPELRTTPNGMSVANFSMATNQKWTSKDGEKQERTEFHTIILWGRLAEVANEYLMKGQECYIEGRMQTREYEAKDGTTRRVTEIVGEVMQMGQRPQNAPKKDSGQEQGRATPEEEKAINLDEEVDEIRIEDVPF